MAIITELQEAGNLTTTKLDYWGGSYSGYLGFVLWQKFPHRFRRMTIANPVVNLLYMTYATDIPEWCVNEAIGKPLHPLFKKI